jgi:hypothetical protein
MKDLYNKILKDRSSEVISEVYSEWQLPSLNELEENFSGMFRIEKEKRIERNKKKYRNDEKRWERRK